MSEFFNKFIVVSGQKGQRELDAVIYKEIRKHDVTTLIMKCTKHSNLRSKRVQEQKRKNERNNV